MTSVLLVFQKLFSLRLKVGKKGLEMEKKNGNILMNRYELGRFLGQGTFAKVYHARKLKSNKSVAVKVIDKEKVMQNGLIDQIKREISVMRLVKHPNVVQLYEVMASKNKIYFAMEYVKGGELFNKVAKGRLKEDAARKYFQQLVAAVDFCHSRGVYHRDLKPENLLLDEFGNLKVTDFGLSALVDSKRNDGLLHTTCGTPAYVSPEVIHKKGYDGEKADIWSCGVILFVLLAGYLPFSDPNLMTMYKKISKAEFKCPQWFHPEVKKLLSKILDPNPDTRMTLAKIMQNPWFQKGFKKIETHYIPKSFHDDDNVFKYIESPKSSFAELKELNDRSLRKCSSMNTLKPTSMNAFDIISLSQGFNLSTLFENDEVPSKKPEARFTTKNSASTIMSKLEEVASTERFQITQMPEGTVRMQGSREGRKGQLAIDAEIFEVTPSFHMVEMKKLAGDTIEYEKFCDQGLKPSLKDIVWTWQGDQQTAASAAAATKPAEHQQVSSSK
ncbi:CBL-interacting serine/threonine-protein kinase 20-like [Rutidosis leptorrhynchoides]|uniref:CBL-interacting serine/threonine-protein kinase 20-like n=1 Tax=Rutidosis leptorrhynchoides TaxID=125765 RepID=UPI003A9903E0